MTRTTRPIRILSVNVGIPRTFLWKDREVTTGIFKAPAKGPIMLRRLNLDGDRQADLENHGGWAKAVYVYPSEHYEFWRNVLPDMELSWGNFGENLTTQGLKEEETHLGDQFRIGEAVVMATQPRIPCYKLGLRLGRDDIVKQFLESHRSGIYFSVVREGLINAGDSMERIKEDEHRITVRDINRAFINCGDHIPLVRRALGHKVLPAGLRDHFLAQISLIERA